MTKIRIKYLTIICQKECLKGEKCPNLERPENPDRAQTKQTFPKEKRKKKGKKIKKKAIFKAGCGVLSRFLHNYFIP